MEFRTWEKVAKEKKEEMINKLRIVVAKKIGVICEIIGNRIKQKQYVEQTKHNRGKLVIPSRGGSRSIANHKFSMEALSGPVMRKKDIHLLSTAETSQSTSKDEEDMKSKVVALEEEVRINEQKVKQSEEKCEKMFQFIFSKFPNSQNILCPPDEDEARAYDDITDLSEQA
ncbi:unnamed protein product [Lactuca saligna]|uniref:Uncharacterized protein n=1 Tax=Lactuca saligna TaxID=75948 RepID=A0AA35VHN8_LACSI|nr:unnamed protein product [Lactuca saligna]